MTTPARALPALAMLALPLALYRGGCNRNTDPGNDREASSNTRPKLRRWKAPALRWPMSRPRLSSPRP